jgi:CheY-like chemotaxis protein
MSPIVVVVDDDPVMQRLLATVLGSSGYQVVTTSDTDEGIQLVREERPDLVLVDATMPGRDGYEFCRELRADPLVPAQPYLVLLTAAEVDPQQVTTAGFDEFISKPIDPPVMLEHLAAIIGQRQ